MQTPPQQSKKKKMPPLQQALSMGALFFAFSATLLVGLPKLANWIFNDYGFTPHWQDEPIKTRFGMAAILSVVVAGIEFITASKKAKQEAGNTPIRLPEGSEAVPLHPHALLRASNRPDISHAEKITAEKEFAEATPTLY